MKKNSAVSRREQVTFWLDNDDDVHCVLDQHAELDLYSADSLPQQSACRHVAPLGHIKRAQSVFVLTH